LLCGQSTEAILTTDKSAAAAVVMLKVCIEF